MSTPESDHQSLGPEGGPIRLGVWSLAWPTMLMFALHSTVGLVDMIFVGSLGTQSVASVGVASQLHFFVFGLLSAVTTGTVALVARETGRENMREVGRITGVSVLLAVGFATVLMGVIPFAEPVIGLLGVDPKVADLGGECLAILLAFNVPFAVGVTLSMALRGAGDVRTPLLIGLVTNVVNIIADYALIFGELGAPELGAPGSAWGSGIAMVSGMLIVLWLWLRGSLLIPAGRWPVTGIRDRGSRLLRIGIPTAVEQFAWHIGLLLFLGLVARYGTEPVSAYLIGVRILSFCFVPGLGFATAASTLVGQYLGAEQSRRAAKAGWRANRMAIIVMGGVGLVIVSFAAPLAGLFGAAGEETVDLTITFIYILGAAQPLMAVEFALGGALRGAGDTRYPLFIILIGLFAFRLAAARFIAIPYFDTVAAVWLCLLADYSIKALLMTLRFRSGRWQAIRV